MKVKVFSLITSKPKYVKTSFLLMKSTKLTTTTKGKATNGGGRGSSRYSIVEQQQLLDKEKPLDPKKQSVLERIDLNLLDEKNNKTGHELRKNRKIMTKTEAKNYTTNKIQISKKSTNNSNNIKSIRFRLGCGIEALTAQNLIELVKSTAPFHFSSIQTPKLVLEENDDNYHYYNDDDETEEKNEEREIDSQTNNCMKNNNNFDSIDYLYDLCKQNDGWKIIIENMIIPPNDRPIPIERIKYFTLCLASHFSTVATYVPTDVDSKIRGHCWNDPDIDVIQIQFELLRLASLHWDVILVSRRYLRIPNSIINNQQSSLISGHDGEWLGIYAGALGSLIQHNLTNHMITAENYIMNELEREAMIFHQIRTSKSSVVADTSLLKIAAIMTHNVGDVDQGLSYWMNANNNSSSTVNHNNENIIILSIQNKVSHKFSRLAHERYERYNGEFGRAKLLYKDLISAEGHRNYPLREVKSLRNNLDFALPLSPWLESWGRMIGTHPGLNHEDRIHVLKQLLRGCDEHTKPWGIPNQVGYFRALYGLSKVMNIESNERVLKDLDKDCRTVLKSHSVRLHLGLSDEAFANKLGKKARELLDNFNPNQ
eukprot:gene14694-19741_t